MGVGGRWFGVRRVGLAITPGGGGRSGGRVRAAPIMKNVIARHWRVRGAAGGAVAPGGPGWRSPERGGRGGGGSARVRWWCGADLRVWVGGGGSQVCVGVGRLGAWKRAPLRGIGFPCGAGVHFSRDFGTFLERGGRPGARRGMTAADRTRIGSAAFPPPKSRSFRCETSYLSLLRLFFSFPLSGPVPTGPCPVTMPVRGRLVVRPVWGRRGGRCLRIGLVGRSRRW